MFKNIRVFWKFALVALMIPLAASVIVASALINSGALKYQYDNLYGFMLLPIIDVEQGNLALERLQTNLHDLGRTDLSAEQRALDIKSASENDKQMLAIINKYKDHWKSSDSPEFTAILKRLGKQDLQNAESTTLSHFDAAYSAYLTQRDAILSAKSVDYADLDNNLNRMSEAFAQLLDVNSQFADLSNTSAQAAFQAMQFQVIVASILASLLALMVAYWISQDVTRPLSRVVYVIQEMSMGRLGNRLNMERRDEIGILARAMDRFADDLQNLVVATLKKIADGDLSTNPSKKDDRDEIGPALIQITDSLRGLVAEAGMLTRAGVEGQLTTRSDASKFKGGYHEIVRGVNNTLDAVIGPLNVAAAYVDKIANGVIPAPITETYNGDFNTLKNNLNRMSDRLREMLSSISEVSNNLGSATAEILAATTQQASGASEQSAAIAQTTTTVEEVKASAEQASMRAQDVATASQRTIEVARGGQTSVQATIESMGMIKERVEGISENLLALSDQTQQIGEIISTVNEIASQSNMLALNASVEAARAGEHGKGFAVVATEVRSLAEQSRQATEQIKAILSEIQKATNSTVMATEEGVKGVDRGVQLSSQSRESIEQLSAVINESAQVAAQVVASGQQQQTGIDQISLAMQNINQVTMQSLASTRQTEKSAQNLNELARKMNEILVQYRF
jgi:methyl-accepting chemotaxis protein